MPVPVAFAAGLAAFFSPCILPLLPVWLAFLGGNRLGSKLILVRNLLLFTAGFTLIFVAMGAGASTVGQYLRQYRHILMPIAGTVIIIFGLQMLGVFNLGFLARERRLQASLSRTPGGYFLLGIILALGWTPCTGVFLGSIIMLASSMDTVFQGMMLLLVYSLGFALPFFVIGLALGSISPFKSGRISRYVQVASGAIMILMGVLLIFNRWSWLQSLVQ
ncbi:MAG: cytochrome c biogenesis CcdA family protein [Bacillota bacterium]|jgi:cytochrome c-type biogenesis protein|nr:cytochrome c biogenesis CcdA family protein [Bacillota bacterium]HPZ21625.1 cytochrome c biogenesis CcdA family protein [Bacillota bacterium]HQD20489.1 cytochrome c biogenesis CcdA family protein [Bacillota bacterium]